MRQPFLQWKFLLQLLLPRHRPHRQINPQHLMIPRHDLPHRPRLAGVKQHEILHQVQQPLLRQHAVQQHLRIQPRLALLIAPLPLVKMIPRRCDRPILRLVAIADDQERIVIKRMRNRVAVVAQVPFVPVADVQVRMQSNRLCC